MPIELTMLAWTAALCVVPAMPYTLGLIADRGLSTMAGNRDGLAPAAGWISRAQRAHANLVENMAPFVALLLAVVVANRTSPTTAIAAQLFFYARAAHAVIYIAGIPWLRSLAWGLGVVAMVMLFAALM
jgi:uncharacterized MAPEG superfamily protein